MNPLTLIHEWFLDSPVDVRLQLLNFAAAYHPTANLNYVGEDEELAKLFEAYLIEELPDKKHVVRRVFFLKSLIEACLHGRDTEEGWEIIKSRNESILASGAEKRPESAAKLLASFLATYDEQKNKWITWCAKWNELVNGQLRYDHLYYYGLNVG